FRTIALDHGRAARMVRLLADRDTILAPQSTLARSIDTRNPYVDPLSFAQVELLRRKRALVKAGEPVPEELERATLLTIKAVAAGAGGAAGGAGAAGAVWAAAAGGSAIGGVAVAVSRFPRVTTIPMPTNRASVRPPRARATATPLPFRCPGAPEVWVAVPTP